MIIEQDNHIGIIQYENISWQTKIRVQQHQMKDLIEDNHVPKCGAYNTELTAIEKNKFNKDGTMGHLTNNMIRCSLKVKNSLISHWLSILSVSYPHMVMLETRCEDDNIIHTWNRLTDDVLRKENNYLNHYILLNQSIWEFFWKYVWY